MFCENQTFANFARVDQFATIKSAKPKLLLVNTHDPCQNAIVRSQRVKFSADLAHSQRFFTRSEFLVYSRDERFCTRAVEKPLHDDRHVKYQFLLPLDGKG